MVSYPTTLSFFFGIYVTTSTNHLYIHRKTSLNIFKYIVGFWTHPEYDFWALDEVKRRLASSKGMNNMFTDQVDDGNCWKLCEHQHLMRFLITDLPIWENTKADRKETITRQTMRYAENPRKTEVIQTR